MAEEQGTVMQAPPPPAPPAPPTTGAPHPPSPGGHRGGSGAIWFGVALLVIGVGIILGRVAPEVNFWGFWPASFLGILFIVFGIRGMFWPPPHDESRLNKVVEGLTSISVGVILISNSTGALPWNVWWSVLSLWPVLLVSAGLDLIGKGLRSTWVRVLSSVVVLVALWYGAFVLPATSASWTWWRTGSASAEPFEFSEPSDSDITSGDAYIEGPVGTLSVTEGNDLVSVTGQSTFGEPTLKVSTSGSKAEVDLRAHQDGPVFFGTGGNPRIDVELDRDVTWDLLIETGVSDMTARLDDLEVSGLRVKTGVSNMEIELGDNPDGDVPITLEAGISQVTIRIPQGTEVRIERDSGISSTNVDGDLIKVDDGWETQGYDDADDRYTVKVSAGISDFQVELY